MSKIYILLTLVLVFSSCSTSVPTIVKYKVASNVDINKFEATKCKSKSVKVSSVLTSSSLMSKDMSYVQGDSKVFEYSESAWLNNPNLSVSRELVKMLRDIDIYKSVQEVKSRSKSDLIIESTLEDFMQYYSNDLKSSFAVVQINLTVIDSKTNEVLLSKTFKSKIKTKSLDAKGGVKALNLALKKVLEDSSAWLIEGCK
ncbi:hypothetical protein FJR48_08385 [Sulfurimonas lithotrophica]|uniref:Uncharacterized protein n=1 Tax=Sulfurimonas lithotrophica TaxID=2590022 RepID=A0A5P8P1Z2_9BACT|nr:ABC-type transport auxiliary lipoprotein family protein [Sulfurimonas lithotrophica]QFR49748.1 hypothetical protein FJR48_08385 [Sulfurimonas lithotrophica]